MASPWKTFYTNPGKIKKWNNFDKDLCKQTNNSFLISLQKIMVVWQLVHMNDKLF